MIAKTITKIKRLITAILFFRKRHQISCPFEAMDTFSSLFVLTKASKSIFAWFSITDSDRLFSVGFELFLGE